MVLTDKTGTKINQQPTWSNSVGIFIFRNTWYFLNVFIMGYVTLSLNLYCYMVCCYNCFISGGLYIFEHREPTQSVSVADCYFIVNVLDLPFSSPLAIYR